MPGDRVAVQVEKSPEAVALYLGCQRAGAVYLPLNPAYPSAEVRYIVDDAEPALMIVDGGRIASLRSRLPRRCRLETLEDTIVGGSSDTAPDRRSDVRRRDDDVAAILYTSGTTGKPKGAMITQANLVSNADALVEQWGMRADDVLLHALPIFHVHGLFVALHCALFTGARMRFLPRFEVAAVIDAFPECSVFMGVPTLYSRLLDDPRLDHACCGRMRLFTCGSAPLRPETFEAFTRRTGHRILERYGMTEAGMITSNPLDGDRVAGTVGHPLPGVEARVVSEDGEAVADGDVGGLEIRGPNVFLGYWRQPEKTAETFSDDGFLRTGDLVTRTEDGRFAIVGRAKDLIITGGYNVYPKEVERALDQQPGVSESAVFGLPHDDFGEAVHAAVVADPGASLEPESLRDALREHLAAYKIPKRILIVEALPRNAMGKVQKNRLRDRFGNS